MNWCRRGAGAVLIVRLSCGIGDTQTVPAFHAPCQSAERRTSEAATISATPNYLRIARGPPVPSRSVPRRREFTSLEWSGRLRWAATRERQRRRASTELITASASMRVSREPGQRCCSINPAALLAGGPPGSRFCPSNRCSPLPAERPAAALRPPPHVRLSQRGDLLIHSHHRQSTGRATNQSTARGVDQIATVSSQQWSCAPRHLPKPRFVRQIQSSSWLWPPGRLCGRGRSCRTT